MFCHETTTNPGQRSSAAVHFVCCICAGAAAKMFNAQFSDTNVSAKYVKELVRKIDETSSVQNKKHNRTLTITNEDIQIVDLGLLEADSTQFNN